MDNLEDARPTPPVAVSEEGHLVFKAGNNVVADLYLGKGAGAGRVDGRQADRVADQGKTQALFDRLRTLVWERWRATRSDGDGLLSLDAERVTPLRDAAPEALSRAPEQPEDGDNAD